MDAMVPRSAPASIDTFNLFSDRSRSKNLSPLAEHANAVDSVFDRSPTEKAPDASPPPLMDAPNQQKKETDSSLRPMSKHIWTPSTGTRLTAMEVAQALSESPIEEGKAEQSNGLPAVTHETATSVSLPRSKNVPIPQTQVEKRRSNYEKYSAIILPPLKEEATPTPSPAGTLKTASVILLDDNVPFSVSEENQAPERLGGPVSQGTETNLIQIPYKGKPLSENGFLVNRTFL